MSSCSVYPGQVSVIFTWEKMNLNGILRQFSILPIKSSDSVNHWLDCKLVRFSQPIISISLLYSLLREFFLSHNIVGIICGAFYNFLFNWNFMVNFSYLKVDVFYLAVFVLLLDIVSYYLASCKRNVFRCGMAHRSKHVETVQRVLACLIAV